VVLLAPTAVTVAVGAFGLAVSAKCGVGAVMGVADVMGRRTATYMCIVVVVLTGLVFGVGTVDVTVVGTGLVVTVAVVGLAPTLALVVVGMSWRRTFPARPRSGRVRWQGPPWPTPRGARWWLGRQPAPVRRPFNELPSPVPRRCHLINGRWTTPLDCSAEAA
jgi:hypothetical protein